MCSFFDVFNGCSRSVKEINRLISKGMYVLLFDVFKWLSSWIKKINRYVKHSLLRKTDVLKTLILSESKFEKMSYLWRAKSYIRGNLYFGIIVFSCLSSTKSRLRFLLICFYREIKDFYQSSLGNEVDFTDKNERFPKYLG